MLFYFIAGVIITLMSSLQVTTSSILVVSNNGDLSTITDSNIPVLLITVISTTGCLITILVLAIVSLIVCLRRAKRKAHIYKMGKYDNYYSYIYSN